MKQRYYREVISGQRLGAAAGVFRFLLSAAKIPYSTVVRVRNRLYSKGLLKRYRSGAVVISVGNITAGGTGKTPLVIWLCRQLEKKEISVAVLTRGYKSKVDKQITKNEEKSSRTDEPAIISEGCPPAKVVVNPDRRAGARKAVNKLGSEVLIMDDGFQHRRLHRDIDIVTLDATEPFGYGKLLPAGLLREPIEGLRRADAIVLTRCDQVKEQQLEKIEEKLKAIKNDMIIAKSIHAPVRLIYQDSSQGIIEELNSKKVFAFCGIGNPNSFLQTLKNIGSDVLSFEIFNDHYHYREDDIRRIGKKAKELKADLIITTHKDWSKVRCLLSTSRSGFEMRVGYLQIELQFIEGEDKLRRLIEKGLESRIFRQVKGKKGK